MKKVVYGVLFFALVGITIVGCQKESINPTSKVSSSDSNEYDSQKFFYENISFYDARIRNLNENQYVQEVYLKNFSDKEWREESIGFQGNIFEDNGKGNDLIANDGVFTSIQKYNFNEKIVYNKNKTIKSVMENSIISPKFNHYSELQSFSKQYKLKDNNKAGGTATITCDVKIVSTGCLADWVWSGFGCLEFSNCSVTVGW